MFQLIISAVPETLVSLCPTENNIIQPVDILDIWSLIPSNSNT
jgi:hypothetical protein